MISIAKNETLRKHFVSLRFAVRIVIRHPLTLHIADRWKITRFVFLKKLLQKSENVPG